MRWENKMVKDEWRYRECCNCYVLWPHLVVPNVCVCGNDMKRNSIKKTLRIIEFEDNRSTDKLKGDKDVK